MSLSEFLEPYGSPERQETEEVVGIGIEDIVQNKFQNFAISAISSIQEIPKTMPSAPKMEEPVIIDDKWKFSSLLSALQVREMRDILSQAKIWEGIGCLNTGKFISMPIKPECKDKSSIQPPYPMSQTKRTAYDAIIAELESQGIVEDAEPTKYCSPCLIVIQNGKPRLVIDFRKINEMTLPDVYPLPRQKDIFAKLQNATYLSLFDFKKAFYQFPVRPEDREKVTFSSRHGGAKRLTRSLMGYINSPAHCQRIVDRIIKPHRWESVIIYVDDIIVFSPDWPSHLRHVHWVLKEVEKVGLTLDPTKAFVGFRSVELLGHLVNKFGLATQEQKVRAMAELPVPENLQDLRQILGFFGYYREFIRNFAQVVLPLTSLLSSLSPKDATLSRTEKSSKNQFCRIKLREHWTQIHDDAFADVKRRLQQATYLTHGIDDPEAQYILYIDACKLGFGAALHTLVDIELVPPEFRPTSNKGQSKVERPVSYISKTLSKSEERYWPTELEMGGLVWALKRFEELIEGKKLMIYTDHSALTWLFSSTNSKTKYNQRLLLWTMAIQQWTAHASIVHRPGRSHLNADVLSRYPVDVETPADLKRSLTREDAPPLSVGRVSTVMMSESLRNDLVKGYEMDRHWLPLIAKIRETDDKQYHSYKLDANGLLYYHDAESKEWKLCIPSNCHKTIFAYYHDSAGHGGFKRTYDKMAASCQMPALSRRLRSYINSCPECAANRPKDRLGGFLHPLELAAGPLETITMDFVVRLPPSGGFDAILTITDKFSKLVTLIPAKTNDSAVDTASRWIASYYSRFGVPRNIVSDRDVKFVSRFWRELFHQLDCSLLMSTAYSPQTDGQSERTNQTMEVMLRSMLVNRALSDWIKILPIIEFNVNLATSESSGKSPFEVLYGFRPRSMLDLANASGKGSSVNPEVEDISEAQTLVRSEVKAHLAYARAIMSKHYDSSRHESPLSVDDWVLIENRPGLAIPGLPNAKLSPKRFGPFKVLELVGAGACKLDLPSNYRMHPVLSNRHLTRYEHDDFERLPPRPPALMIDEDAGEAEYEVESVIDKRSSKNGRKIEYLVKWLGYPVHESTWINSKESSGFLQAIKDYDLRVASAKQETPLKSRRKR